MDKFDDSLDRLSRSSSDAELKSTPTLEKTAPNRRDSTSPTSVAQFPEITTPRPKDEQALIVYQDKRLEAITTLIDAAESAIQHTQALSSLQHELEQVQKQLEVTTEKARQASENIAKAANDFKQRKITALSYLFPLEAERYMTLNAELPALKTAQEILREKVSHEEKSLVNTHSIKQKATFVTKVRHRFGISFRDIEQLSNQLNTMRNQNIIDESSFIPLRDKLYDVQRLQQQMILNENPSQMEKEKVRDDFYSLKETVDALLKQNAVIVPPQEITAKKSLLHTTQLQTEEKRTHKF